jgi:glutaredoxin
MHARRTSCLIGALAVLLTAAAPAQTLYRIVGPDGRVTYTDRPPPGATGAPLGSTASRPAGPASGVDARAMADWPATLRQAATRYPVTFYAAEGCPPCEEARRLLQRRGVPYTERRVSTEEDVRRLQELTGGRLVPAATIGRQAVSGFQEQDWQGWLDSAGYPRTRALPAGWQPAPATPLVPRTAAVAAAPAASQALPRPLPAPATDPGPGTGGIRF